MKIVSLTTIYPNSAQPHHDVFVENRLRHLVAGGDVTARVVAPVWWVPDFSRHIARYELYTQIPRWEERFGLEILHPRFLLIPEIGMTVAPLLMYLGVRATLGRMIREGYDFDLIDAHYFYPDGVAATMLGRHFNRPVTITARGTDVNVIPSHASPRRQIVRAARHAAAVISVSAALKRRMVEIGIPGDSITVLRNGVDLENFKPLPRAALRAELGVSGPVLVAVGNLLASKGQDVAIRALAHLDGAELLLVGTGDDEAAFRRLAERCGVARRVRFVGRVGHDDLARYYSAADISILASMREGWPNVVLESLACGTPVVASDVGGVAEIITRPEAGRLMAERTPEALAEAVGALLADSPDRAATRAHAEGFSWDATTRGQLELFNEILSQPPDTKGP